MKADTSILEISSIEPNMQRELADLLIRVVEDGASIGFIPPLGIEEALQYWGEVCQPGVLLLVALIEGKIVGTVQLHLAMKKNASHRAEVAKLMVDPGYRKQGIGRQLMHAIEQVAKTEERSLLVLDTRAGDPSNILYRSLG